MSRPISASGIKFVVTLLCESPSYIAGNESNAWLAFLVNQLARCLNNGYGTISPTEEGKHNMLLCKYDSEEPSARSGYITKNTENLSGQGDQPGSLAFPTCWRCSTKLKKQESSFVRFLLSINS